MSNKGRVFTAADAPSGIRNAAKREAWAQEQTSRNKVVAIDDETGLQIIAEELTERALRKLSPGARVVATQMLMQLDPAGRREVCSAFDASGELRVPFRLI